VKRFIVVLIVLAGGLAAAAFTIPTDAATVNGSVISQSLLNSDITAIANSRDYQCFLNAQAYAESQGQQLLAPVDGVGQTPGSGMHPTATTAFVAPYVDTEISHVMVANLAAQRGLQATTKEVDAARSELSTEITQTMSEVSQVPNHSVTCGPAPTLTGPVVLATMPASFVTQTATFDATVGLLENHLSGADTTAGLMRYFNANHSIFDTACFTVAQYTTQADATSALKEVSSGMPFAQVAAAAGTGSGPQGCDILYGIVSQLPAGTNLQTLADNQVSAPISLNGSYLLLEITSRTPTSFAKATSSVHLALERLGSTDAVKLLQATEKRAAISVNPRYGTWNPTVAQVEVPTTPAVGDVLNPAVNDPGAASATATPSGSATPSTGQSG
jgi:hypothetical protein